MFNNLKIGNSKNQYSGDNVPLLLLHDADNLRDNTILGQYTDTEDFEQVGGDGPNF